MPPPCWYSGKEYTSQFGSRSTDAWGLDGVFTKARVVVIVTKDVSSKLKVQVVVDEGAARAEGRMPIADDVQINLLDDEGREVPAGEPLYVLRGSNLLATMVLEMYKDVLAELDLEDKDAALAELAKIAAAFAKYEAENQDGEKALI